MADADTGTQMTPARRADLEAELGRLRTTSNSGPLDRAFAGIGIGAAVVGLIACLVAYAQSTGFDDVRDQMESLIVAIFGLGLVVFGSVLYLRNAMTRFLRFWLLRLVYEQRDLAGRAQPETVATPAREGTPAERAEWVSTSQGT